MQTEEVEAAIQVLSELERLENLVGDFYSTCAIRWRSNDVYWEATARAEHGHAEVVTLMKELVRKFPASFHLSPAYTSQNVLHCLARVQEIKEQVAGGSYSEEDAFLIALDIEEFLLEKGLAEVLSSDLEEYKHYQDKIISETSNHRAMFKVMLGEVNMS